MTSFILIAAITCGALLVLAGILHAIPLLGSGGRRLATACCRAPLLDVIITIFTIAPLIIGPIIAGWIGLASGIAGQYAALILWTILHELAHPAARRGPRIHRVLNRKVGVLRNLLAVYLTSLVTPAFWIVRVAQVALYPALVWLVRLPPYRAGEWVDVSRQKFSGLIGHDLIWCLYCDWMTGVWSLGSEMLRNVESFWCPIRFASAEKCANCRIDFPDLDHGWVRADGDMADVAATLERMYPDRAALRHERAATYNTWYQHPARLTVNGEAVPARDRGVVSRQV